MATPESAPASTLVIRTRSDAAGIRWEGQFDIQFSKGGASLQQLSEGAHPEKSGTLEKFVLRAPRRPEGIEAAVDLVRNHVKDWAIHWIRLGEIAIRERTPGLTPGGIQEDEIPRLREAILQQIK